MNRTLWGMFCVAIAVLGRQPSAEATIKYPVILGAAELKALGFENKNASTRQNSRIFSLRCPMELVMNLSPRRLQVYRSKGLTFKHVCAALSLSPDYLGRDGLTYHPETGAHLTTYILRYATEFGEMEDGEMPLEVPSCFGLRPVKTGRDAIGKFWAIDLRGCKLRYNTTTGRKLSSTEKIKLLARGLRAPLVVEKGPSGGEPPPNPTIIRTTSSRWNEFRADVNRK
jgi:hypothetical protein